VGGGGYFRMLPYALTRWGIGRLNRVERRPAIFYLHPWEVDPAQPRIAATRLSRLRHYRNLDKTETRLRSMMKEFRFSTLSDMLATAVPQPGGARAAVPEPSRAPGGDTVHRRATA
jgi:hypothetical protein